MRSFSQPGGPVRELRENTLPAVSIIIPIPPEMKAPQCLCALGNLDYPKSRYEVILARGRNPSKQRNIAARSAKGEILFFLDDDSIADGSLLRKNVSFYVDGSVACVGGPNIAGTNGGLVAKAVGSVLASLFGDFRGCRRFARRGGMRYASEDGLILCNASVRKEIFEEVGGFPEMLYPNEENAFFSKILNHPRQYKLVYAPDAFVSRARPSTIRRFVQKIFSYGVGRLNQTFVSPSLVCGIRLVAALFPIYCMLLPLLNLPMFRLPAALYLLADMGMTLKILADVGSLRLAALSALLFPVMHASYGAGLLWGLLAKAMRVKRTRSNSVELVHRKRFADSLGKSPHGNTRRGFTGANVASGRNLPVEEVRRALQAASRR